MDLTDLSSQLMRLWQVVRQAVEHEDAAGVVVAESRPVAPSLQAYTS